jgi:hypothetical protein
MLALQRDQAAVRVQDILMCPRNTAQHGVEQLHDRQLQQSAGLGVVDCGAARGDDGEE